MSAYRALAPAKVNLGLFLGPAIMSVFAALLRVYRKEYSGSRKEAA